MAADGFVTRASLGDVDEITRRLERRQEVNGKHSVRVYLAAVRVFVRINLFDFAQRLKYTALHAAADNGHLSVVEVLISFGADVNAQRTVSSAG